MTKKLKREVFMACLVRVSRGILEFGAIKEIGEAFDLFPATVSNLWHRTLKMVPGHEAKAPIDTKFIVDNVPPEAFEMKFQNAGRKPQFDNETVLQEIKNIDPNARRSIRSLAGAIGVSKRIIGTMKMEKKLRVHTMSLKPKLNDDHLLNRRYHSISKIDKNTITSTAEMKYKTMYNEVHVDEKWFYLVKDGGRYILTADEVDPPPVSVAHKSHITKVMFLCALARPQHNYTTRQEFNGLIGIYPVGKLDMYVQTSSRPGDIKWSNVNMDRDLYQKMLVDLVLPDIKKKMPATAGNIILQQDGANSHLPEDDWVFKAKVMELYGDPNAVKLYTQLA
jgi:hypothetical protein